jgi:hypothetical protein
MTFKEWLTQNEAFEKTRDYKKRRPGAVTGAAKMARRGGGIAAAVTPANLSKAPNTSPAGQTFKGIDIGGPIYDQPSKVIDLFKKKTYLPSPF